MSQDDLIREIHGDVKLIKSKLDDLSKAERGIEDRISPLEDDYKFRKQLGRVVVGLVGILGTITSIVGLLFHFGNLG